MHRSATRQRPRLAGSGTRHTGHVAVRPLAAARARSRHRHDWLSSATPPLLLLSLLLLLLLLMLVVVVLGLYDLRVSSLSSSAE